MADQVFLRHTQHSACSRCGVVEAAHNAGLSQGLVVFDEDEVHHQLDDLTRGEVFPGGLVGQFCELANQLLKHQPHLGVAHRSGVQVNLAELLGDQVQQVGLVEAVHLEVELKALKDVPHRWGERLDIAA